jgi:hypothetical protein
LALAAAGAGCARSTGSPSGGDPAAGQFGEAPAGGQGPDSQDGQGDGGGGADPAPEPTPDAPADPPADPPAEEDPEPDPPGGGFPFVTFTFNPDLFLLWPSPADCVSHNPANLITKYNATSAVWQVVDGSHSLLAYKRLVDAQAGLALAKAFKKHCFIGRANTRPDRYRYIMDYWLEPVQPSPSIASPDCVAHNPANLTVANLGALGWRVEAGNQAIALFDTKADAEKAVLVMKHYNRNCYVGRGYDGADRLKYITNWFASA